MVKANEIRVELWIQDCVGNLVFALARFRDGSLHVFGHPTAPARNLTPEQFQEMHSFALFCGHTVRYAICDADLNETRRVTYAQ